MIYTAERISSTTKQDNPIYRRQLFAYLSSIPYIEGDVLEIGSGTGYGAKILSGCSRSYTAIDKYNPQNIYNLTNINFLKIKVPPIKGFQNNSFDRIISYQLIEHIQDDVFFMKEVKRLLKTNGTFIFTTPNRLMSLSRNPYHVREYSLGELKKLLDIFPSYEILGIYGNDKVNAYYNKNKESVNRITKFDLFNLRNRLPRQVLQIPYNMANTLSRKWLHRNVKNMTEDITENDFRLDIANDECYDFFCIVSV